MVATLFLIPNGIVLQNLSSPHFNITSRAVVMHDGGCFVFLFLLMDWAQCCGLSSRTPPVGEYIEFGMV